MNSSTPRRPQSTAVTIVATTHNRGKVLARVIRCARAQTFADWTMLVIGDKCTDDTGARIAAFGDERISFINLPERFGEQAGPNSVGMALAETPFVAFLNHDDYWLPDHLQTALDAFEGQEGELYWSRAAFFTNRGARADRAIFVEVSPSNRTLDEVPDVPHFYSEPMSSWVARKGLLERLGPMTLAGETALTPLQDYALRAWRAGCRLIAGEAITVLKDNLGLRASAGTPLYALEPAFAEEWVRWIEAGEVDRIMRVIEEDLWLARALRLDRQLFAGDWSKVATRAALHHQAGLDLLSLETAARAKKSFLLDVALKRRTNDVLAAQADLAAMIDHARHVR